MKVTYTVCLWDDGKDCFIRIDSIRFTGGSVPTEGVKAAEIVSWIGREIVVRTLAGGEVECSAVSGIGVSFAASVRRTGAGFVPCGTGVALSVYRYDSAGNVTLTEQLGCSPGDGGSGCEATCPGAELQ
jgi:hypothetical protein